MTDHPLPDAARIGSPSATEAATDSNRPTRSLATPLSALSFWLAIVLPALYLPLLVTGLSSTADLTTFLGLFGLHVVALLGGHSHGR